MNRPLFQLDPRLSLCASLVRPGKKVADIGTDHAYLPIWLVRSGAVPLAIASDVREGPLRAAEENIRKYQTEDRVALRLSDGLKNFSPGEADDVVIAGMGGELIARIVAETPWLKSPECRLVLQPMTSAGELRKSLSAHGFCVCREKAVWSENHIYTAMSARYFPEETRGDELFAHVGALDPSEPESRDYFRLEIARLEKQARGLMLGGRKPEAEHASFLAAEIARELDRSENKS